MNLRHLFIIILSVFATQHTHSQSVTNLRIGTEMGYHSDFSIVNSSEGIQNVPYLFGFNIDAQMEYEGLFGRLGFVSRFNNSSGSNLKSSYLNNGLSFGFGKTFRLKDNMSLDIGLAYIFRTMNINTSASNPQNSVSGNQISFYDGVNLLNIYKYSHGLGADIGLKLVDELYITLFYELDLSKSRWQSLNGKLINSPKDPLNFLGLKIQYSIARIFEK
ncbi:MAG: hypothetical protein GX330_03765 [Bacteroidales bacterium]|nr:hypothetical protein [Bacteroidales bacterium]